MRKTYSAKSSKILTVNNSPGFAFERILPALAIYFAGAFFCLGAVVNRADDFVEFLGVNTHLGYTDTVYREFSSILKPRLLELGVRHIRDGTWSEEVARKYEDLGRSGIQVLLISDSRRALTQATRLGTNLFGIEARNEPDTRPDWETSTRQEQRSLFFIIKSNAATARLPVVVSSLANIRDSPGRLGDLSAHLDFGNMHPYAAGSPPGIHWGWGLSMARALQEALKVSGSRPILVTECGYHNRVEEQGHPGVPEEVEAIYLPGLFLIYFNQGIKRAYKYELLDLKPDPELRDKERHFGLLRNDGSTKPSFLAMKELIATLSDPGPNFPVATLEYSLNSGSNTLHHALFQKRDGTYFLAIYRDVSVFDRKTRSLVRVPPLPITVSLEKPMSLQILNPTYPNKTTATISPRSIHRLEVPAELIFLKLTDTRSLR